MGSNRTRFRFSLKSLLLVTTCIGVALALIPLLPETVSILLAALTLLFGASALFSRLFGAASFTARVVANALTGAVAGGVPGLVYSATMEGNGLGGLAAMAATLFGAGLGLIAGGIVGACGAGVRLISNIGLAKILTAACLGAAFAASGAWWLIGIGNESKVVSVLALSVIGLITGMFVSTDR